MAEREMEQIRVYEGDKGHICISQYDAVEQTESVVIIHPAQVDLLIQWLKEMKEEVQKE